MNSLYETSYDELLQPGPLMLETGVRRLDDGRLLVAARTELPGCAGRMFDWWFTFFDSTQHIRWWHPHDHVELRGWDGRRSTGRGYVGATVRAVEALGEVPPVPAVLKFHPPETFFGAGRLSAALARGDVSAAVCARIAFGEEPRLSADGDPLDGEMVHLTRDTAHGAVLRSRFLLGAADGVGEPVPERLGLELMRHCYNEFSCLARLLPSLYYGEHANGEKGPLAW
ncbi:MULTISPECIES: DAPG hydrolase family protein [Chromobacterium]|uniref:DAPG hydrolase family protein n=1 Tax=Chromobacterium TaxID=535 RepID=UPI000DEF70E8|nr:MULTISPECIES: hydrolase [Chromobacterium]QOZ83521.1 hydrolase [Chromobacterium sp. Rain0013]UGA36898.1 hydrolase [Chromobacterium haemolyticum]WON83636.1 hydrolase [Chromobacterium haemolyticum]